MRSRSLTGSSARFERSFPDDAEGHPSPPPRRSLDLTYGIEDSLQRRFRLPKLRGSGVVATALAGMLGLWLLVLGALSLRAAFTSQDLLPLFIRRVIHRPIRTSCNVTDVAVAVLASGEGANAGRAASAAQASWLLDYPDIDVFILHRAQRTVSAGHHGAVGSELGSWTHSDVSSALLGADRALASKRSTRSFVLVTDGRAGSMPGASLCAAVALLRRRHAPPGLVLPLCPRAQLGSCDGVYGAARTAESRLYTVALPHAVPWSAALDPETGCFPPRPRPDTPVVPPVVIAQRPALADLATLFGRGLALGLPVCPHLYAWGQGVWPPGPRARALTGGGADALFAVAPAWRVVRSPFTAWRATQRVARELNQRVLAGADKVVPVPSAAEATQIERERASAAAPAGGHRAETVPAAHHEESDAGPPTKAVPRRKLDMRSERARGGSKVDSVRSRGRKDQRGASEGAVNVVEVGDEEHPREEEGREEGEEEKEEWEEEDEEEEEEEEEPAEEGEMGDSDWSLGRSGALHLLDDGDEGDEGASSALRRSFVVEEGAAGSGCVRYVQAAFDARMPLHENHTVRVWAVLRELRSACDWHVASREKSRLPSVLPLSKWSCSLRKPVHVVVPFKGWHGESRYLRRMMSLPVWQESAREGTLPSLRVILADLSSEEELPMATLDEWIAESPMDAHASVTVVRRSRTQFSRSFALALGLKASKRLEKWDHGSERSETEEGDAVVLLMDTGVAFGSTFLAECSALVQRGRVALNPMVYRIKDRDAVLDWSAAQLAHSGERLDGEWNPTGHGILAASRADLERTGAIDPGFGWRWGCEDALAVQRLQQGGLVLLRFRARGVIHAHTHAEGNPYYDHVVPCDQLPVVPWTDMVRSGDVHRGNGARSWRAATFDPVMHHSVVFQAGEQAMGSPEAASCSVYRVWTGWDVESYHVSGWP